MLAGVPAVAQADTATPPLTGGDAYIAPETAKVVTPHILELGSQDDSAIASGNTAMVSKSFSLASKMGAVWERIIVHPSSLQKFGWDQYDTAITVAKQQHMKLDVTASLEGVSWTDSRVKKYFLLILAHLATLRHVGIGNEPDAIGIGNEVNRASMLKAMPGLSQALTYRRVWQDVQPVITSALPKAQLFYAELSSGDDPIDFARAVATPGKQSDPAPLKMIGKFAYHPYQFMLSPDEETPDDDPGMGALAVVENEIQSEQAEGLIETADGQPIKLALTETGWWGSLRGEVNDPRTPLKLKPRYLTDVERRVNYRMELNVACNDPLVDIAMAYGMFPPQQGWKGFWDTGLVNANGQTTGTYKMIRDFSALHPECIQAPAVKPTVQPMTQRFVLHPNANRGD